MRKVTSYHEEGDVLRATVTEATDELERAQNDQDRLQDELDCSCEDMATAAREFFNCWARKKRQLQRQAVPSEKSAINELPMRRSAWKLGKHGKEHTT